MKQLAAAESCARSRIFRRANVVLAVGLAVRIADQAPRSGSRDAHQQMDYSQIRPQSAPEEQTSGGSQPRLLTEACSPDGYTWQRATIPIIKLPERRLIASPEQA